MVSICACWRLLSTNFKRKNKNMKTDKLSSDNGIANGVNTLIGCVFCHGTGMAKFVDMSKVPDYTSMVMGDETWKKHEEIGVCPEGCQVLN